MKLETIEQYLYKNHTDQTAKTYLYYIQVFKMRQPNSLKMMYADILEYINTIRQSGRNAEQISPQFAAIKKYYDYLLETGQRNDHPCSGISLRRKKKPVQLQDLFTPTELELLMGRENRFNNLGLRNKVAISLLIHQGLTCSELCRIDLKDIDLDGGTVYVKGSKKCSARILGLKSSQILLIKNYIETSRKNLLKSNTSFLLITQRGVPETVDGINSMVESLKGMFLGKNLNPSTIRQSVISNLLNVYKKPLEDVQLFAGHKWPSSTEQYRRKDINEQREMINKWHPLK